MWMPTRCRRATGRCDRSALPAHTTRHGRACPGHPRLFFGAKDVDARPKAGHDGERHRRRPRVNAASVPGLPLHDFKQPRKRRMANGGVGRSGRTSIAFTDFLFAICSSPFVSFLSLFTALLAASFPIRHSQHTSSHSPPPMRGGRSAVALGCLRGTLSARHDRRAVASLDQRRLGVEAGPMRSLRMAGEPGLRSISQAGRAGLREASCVPSDGDARLSALRVGFLARARARRCLGIPSRIVRATSFAARVIVTRRSRSREPPRRGR
jgi:hypothetical protein